MQTNTNCHMHLWLLSGTGEGRSLASAFVNKGWKVTVSVVSPKALLGYEGLDLHARLSGALEGVEGIRRVLDEARSHHDGFKFVIDATHPFALVITKNLKQACAEADQKLLRFERVINLPRKAILINSFEQLAKEPLSGKNLLLAIGSRLLPQAVEFARSSGANIFVRVPPSAKCLQCATSIGLNPEHVALINPLSGENPGSIEKALCQRWSIDAVVCRQSGGVIEDLWHKISKENDLRLFLLARPPQLENLDVVHSLHEVIKKISQ